MPQVYKEPTSSVKDTNAYVNFIKPAHKDIYTYVNFNPGSNFYIPASVNFLKKVDVASYVNFINPNVTQDINAYVNFVYHNVVIPASVSFSIRETLDILSSVLFKYNTQVESSVTFIQSDEVSIPSYVNFKIPKDIPSFVTFRIENQVSIPAFVFLGSFRKDLNASVIFSQFSKKDFRASIQINQVVVQKTTNSFNTSQDFPSSIFINGVSNKDIPSFVNFRVPPFDIDFPAVVHFTQFDKATFKAQITIQNKLLGGGGVGVVIQSGPMTIPGNNSPSLPVQNTPPVSGNSLNVNTDSTGYFSIDNLSPGNYTIIPNYPGLNFNPAAYHVTITNSNVQLYFDASGNLVNQVATASSLPPAPTGSMCLIDTNGNSAGVGSFSIEGYIGLKFPTDTYTDILTIITDENLASLYRKTIDSRYDLDT